eukprot:7084430-Ditylum_brightwellii.AAC.1
MRTRPAATIEARICKAQEAIVQVQSEINRLEACRAALSARHIMTTVPDVTPVNFLKQSKSKWQIPKSQHLLRVESIKGPSQI